MTTLVQGLSSIKEFYQCVYSHLSLILNKISCADYGSEATTLLTKTYRDKALDTFIRGLNFDLPRLLAMREPTDLPQALQLCLKLENQNFRSLHANNAFKSNSKPPALLPNKPANQQQQFQPKQLQQQQNQQQQYKQPFYPQLAHIPRVNNHQGRQQNYFQPMAPPRPYRQMQKDEVVPMEVDGTIQTRRVDYANRNAMNTPNHSKRPLSSNSRMPSKMQRTFYLNKATNANANNNHNNAEYFENFSANEINTFENLNDVHFLG